MYRHRAYPRGDRSLKFLTRSPETTRARPSIQHDRLIHQSLPPLVATSKVTPLACQRSADELFFPNCNVNAPTTRSRKRFCLLLMPRNNDFQEVEGRRNQSREEEIQEEVGGRASNIGGRRMENFWNGEEEEEEEEAIYRIDWKAKKSRDGRWSSPLLPRYELENSTDPPIRAYIIQTRTILNYPPLRTYSYIFNDLFFAIPAHWPAAWLSPNSVYCSLWLCGTSGRATDTLISREEFFLLEKEKETSRRRKTEPRECVAGEKKMAGPPLINNRTERSRGLRANREKGRKRRGGGEGERETETRVVLSSTIPPASPFSFPSSLLSFHLSV